MRVLSIPLLCLILAGCGGADMQLPPFQGHWRKYEDPQGRFVKFDGNQLTIGDKSQSHTGPYTYSDADEDEPLYDVQVKIPDHEESFQLYYEKDTVFLVFADDEDRSGMYEIIVDADFKPSGKMLP